MRTKYVDDMKNISARFRSVRSLVSPARKDFCQKHKLSTHTVQSWEIGRTVPNKTGLENFIRILAKEGVSCSSEWLIDGKGESPSRMTSQHDIASPSLTAVEKRKVSRVEEQLIKDEIKAIRDSHKKAKKPIVIVRLKDDTMEPKYNRGDYVAGRPISNDKIKQLVGSTCVVEIGKGNYVVRKLLREGKRYLLQSANAKSPLVTAGELRCASEIIWHRRSPSLS